MILGAQDLNKAKDQYEIELERKRLDLGEYMISKFAEATGIVIKEMTVLWWMETYQMHGTGD